MSETAVQPIASHPVSLRQTSRIATGSYGALLTLLALLYTLGFFTGIEHHAGYYGNAYKAIHPESFPKDQYVTGHQPAYASLFYLMAKLAGDAWLDDRVHIVFYFGLTLFAILGVDRLAILLGISGRFERLAIVTLMLLPHRMKDNLGDLVPWANHSGTTFTHPIAIWIAVMIFEGRTVASLALSLLIGSFAPKNGWYPSFMAALHALHERWRWSWSRVAWTVIAGLGLIFGLFLATHWGNPEPARLYDIAVQHIELAEANPMLERGIGNILFTLLLLGTITSVFPSAAVTARVRAFGAITACMFVFTSVYYTYAPDPLKIPFLQALAFNRATWWPQVIMMIVVSCQCLRWMRQPSLIARAAGAVILLTIYLIPIVELYTLTMSPLLPKRAVTLAVLLVIAGVATAILRRRPQPRWLDALRSPGPAPAVLLAVILSTGLYLTYKVKTQRPYLRFLAQHGIMGDSPGAKWVGINEYIREHTPADATILPLVMQDYPWRSPGLRPDGSLKTRTGRSMPIGHPIMFYFDYHKQLWLLDQDQHLQALVKAWERRDWTAIAPHLRALGSPDYLVVPIEQGEWLRDATECPYHLDTTINGFQILRRTRDV